MKIYISGKITGTDDYLERFSKAEIYLKSKGYDVINPAAINSLLPKSTTYSEYMYMSTAMMDICDGIYFLKGWEESHGASIEYGYGLAHEMNMMYEGCE